MFRNYKQLLRHVRSYYTVKSDLVQKEIGISKQLYSKIKLTGPITMAEYMKEVLTNPGGGYYMNKDVFGQQGDFITSPEVSQVFGELIAIWFLNEWSKCGKPSPLQIVELGPGRGSLCQDILRVFNKFDALKETSVHLVEVSPLLSDVQARKLCINNNQHEDSLVYRDGISLQGTPIKWYRKLNDVPTGFTLFVAHEFFDALPIHTFKKTEKGYREILVDIDPQNDNNFRYVLSPEETAMQKLFLKPRETKQQVEVSPESILIMQSIAQRIEEYGGVALIADYGHSGEKEDTFRSFKKHKLHDPLVEPGTADLTADVNFADLKSAAINHGAVLSFGPVTQRDFLLRMGCEERYSQLEKQMAGGEQLKQLKEGYKLLTDSDKMGERFKFMSLLPKSMETIINKYPVIGFY